MEFSFGEQIIILLKRKNMTIQDLATLYEEQTGNKMSRQNLTQRLKRDNFPEQDMHVIAKLLGYHVSIQLNPIPVPVPKLAQLEATTPFQIPQSLTAPTDPPEFIKPSFLTNNIGSGLKEITNTEIPDSPKMAAKSSADSGNSSGLKIRIPDAFKKSHFKGEINPLTGEEYLTNTVRRHPDMEDYVQVYDQGTHSWSDVQEDYFWQFQAKKKQMLGKDYQAPILI